MRIAVVAGELSGDHLACGLIDKLKQTYPDAIIEGIAGPKMMAAGCMSLFPLDVLSVMGFSEVLKNLYAIWQVYRQLRQHWQHNPPDLFIGIDAPDFNLKIADKLKQQGCKTVQYVSPSVWAWKAWRIKKIKRATDLVLCLFPFEAAFYQQHHHPAVFVGHPKADQIPLQVDTRHYRQLLNLETDGTYIALLPGSRHQELKYLLPTFLQTVKRCLQYNPTLKFLLPLAKPKLMEDMKAYKTDIDTLPITLLMGQSQEAMAAANTILLASGTATLEAMLWKKPMVVAYRCSWLTYHIVKYLITIKFIALPNILAGKYLVPEFIQKNARAESLAIALMSSLDDSSDVQKEFIAMHHHLKQDADALAFEAVQSLISDVVGHKISISTC